VGDLPELVGFRLALFTCNMLLCGGGHAGDIRVYCAAGKQKTSRQPKGEQDFAEVRINALKREAQVDARL